MRPAPEPMPGSAIYESDRAVSEYLLFHFGSADDLLGGLPGPAEAAGFAARLVRDLLDPARLGADARALDVGCAVGGSAFELARHCAGVVGIDFSAAFVRAAQRMAESGSQPCQRVEQGEIAQRVEVALPAGTPRERCRFETGDACDLRADLGAFDVVLAANLICRLAEPRQFLGRLRDLVPPGGQLLLTTPFTWLESYTPRDRWLGGTPETGPSFEALAAALEPDFSLDLRKDIPFLIREHARKFQYSVALGTRWTRRG